MHEKSEPFVRAQVGYARCELATRGVSNGECPRRVNHWMGGKWGALEGSEVFEEQRMGFA
jgi:hypothetical protein